MDWAGESAMAGSERYTAGDSDVGVALTSLPAAHRVMDSPGPSLQVNPQRRGYVIARLIGNLTASQSTPAINAPRQP